jgi:hypothetical protein
MRWLAFLEMHVFLLAAGVFYSAPVLLGLLLVRNRVQRHMARALLAGGCAAGTAYMIWRMEWFDVWRHGFPSLSYLMTAFAPYMILSGAVGWALGRSPFSSAARRDRSGSTR